MPQAFGQRGRGRRFAPRVDPSQIPAYKFRTVSVSQFPALQAEYDRFRGDVRLSRSKTFQDKVASLNFRLPRDFPNAKSVIVVAAFAKTMYANFQLQGRSYRIMVPFQYYLDDLNARTLTEIVRKDIIKEPGHRVVDISETVPLKHLAARSGLGRYGRNNVIFVDGMGSYNLLYAFLTDYSFPDNSWSEIELLDICRRCDHCDRICPTYCISRGNFLINIDKCITLYNENAGSFPNWILGSMHHALMGCMRCQAPCRVNGGVADISGQLEDITEEETRKVLQGTPDETLLVSLQRKLRQFPAAASRELFPILTRNLNALIRA